MHKGIRKHKQEQTYTYQQKSSNERLCGTEAIKHATAVAVATYET